MKIRRILCALLAALLLSMPALAEQEADFGFDFGDEGYTGEWLELTELGIEFCLPDGWAQIPAGDGEAFAAASADGAATLAIRLEAEDIEDIVAWGDECLSGYEVDTTGFFDTLIAASEGGLTVYRLNNAQVLAFAFTRESEDALTRDFALEIVDSVNEAWAEDGDFYEPEDDESNPLAGD